MSVKSPEKEKSKGSRRISIAVSDELYQWIEEKASELGLAPATFGTVLLNEARRNRENSDSMMAALKSMSGITPDLYSKMIDANIMELQEKSKTVLLQDKE